MRVGRRTTLALLAAIVVVSLLVRYPRSDHELGSTPSSSTRLVNRSLRTVELNGS